MTLDLNQTIDSILAWDFPITLNGKTFQTRPPTLADMAVIARMGSATPPSMMEVSQRLFQPADGLNEWLGGFGSHHVVGAINGVLEYARQSLSKNSPAIALKIKEAMAATLEQSAGSFTRQ